MKTRLDKFVASALNISRSDSVKLIVKGKIKVNGIIEKIGKNYINEYDIVTLDEKVLISRDNIWLMMNKPHGVISASNDNNTKTVIDLIPENLRAKSLFPCGRLDKDTTGLLLITNDGLLAHALLAPKNKVAKKYYFKTDISYRDFINEIESGVSTGGDKFAPCKIEIISDTDGYIILTEGKYHEIKRIFDKFKIKIIALKRISFGDITLDDSLSPGDVRQLTEKEITLLKNNLKGD